MKELEPFLDCPWQKSILIEIVAYTESRPVAFPDHADRTLFSARLFPSSRCSKQRFLHSAISFWSCNVRAVGVGCVSVGLTRRQDSRVSLTFSTGDCGKRLAVRA